MVPKESVVDWRSLLAGGDVGASELTKWSLSESKSAEVDDVVLAVCNHLVGNLNEKSGHSLICVVVARDRVNHLDRVHERGKSLLNGLRCAFVEWLNELFQGL